MYVFFLPTYAFWACCDLYARKYGNHQRRLVTKVRKIKNLGLLALN